MKLLFVIKSLSLEGGGAERVLVDVTRVLAARGHDITIACFDRDEASDFYPVDPRVRRLKLGVGTPKDRSGPLELWRRILALRRAASSDRPDVAVGFMVSGYLPLALGLLARRIPVIASEHTDIAHWRRDRLQFAVLWASVSRYAAMTAVSEAIKSGYPRALSRRMVAIANPVTRASGEAPKYDASRKIILSVGRLGVEKDHATLVAAFAQLAERHSDWDLRIVGEGALRRDLERQVEALGMAQRIMLPGATRDIDGEYRRADLYAHPAAYESFGLATAEALAHGVAAVGFADCPGTNELIVDGDNGVLVQGVDRVAQMAQALDRLMSSSELRAALASRAPASMERFSIGRVADAWEDLLGRVAHGARTPFEDS